MLSCASCGIELAQTPFVVAGNPFCCSGCSEGGRCVSTYENDPNDYPATVTVILRF